MSVDLKRFELLSEFGEEDREAFACLAEADRLAAGRYLFREGSEAEDLVLLLRGSLSLESDRAGSLGSVPAGSSLGAWSLVALGRRECSALADEDCDVLRLSRTAFLRLSEDAPQTACRLLQAVAKDLVGIVREGLEEIAPALATRAGR